MSKQYLYPFSLDTSTAGNKVALPKDLRGLRLETLPPGAVLGLLAKDAKEPVRFLLPGSTYHFEEEGSEPSFVTVITAVSGVAYFTGWAKGVILLGGSTTPRRFGSAVVSFADDPPAYAGGSGDIIGDLLLGTCPPDRTWQVLGASAFFRASAVVGARAPTFKIVNGRGTLQVVLTSGAINANGAMPLVLYANTTGIDGFQFFAYPLECPPNGKIILTIGDLTGAQFPQAGDQLSRGYLYVRENVE